MFNDFLSSISGISVYPIISVILFMLVFTGVLVYVITANKNLMKRYSQIPFNDNNNNENHYE